MNQVSELGLSKRSASRGTGAAMLVVSLLIVGTLLASPATANDDKQDDWRYFDNPSLNGPMKYWSQGTSGGIWNNYHYTYGIGNSNKHDNWAVWNVGHRHGRQSVWVHVPRAPANVQANVLYHVYRNNEIINSKRIDQGESEGWEKLGDYWFKGGTVRIEVHDHQTKEHYDRDNPSLSRIGIDAIAMRCTYDCGNTELQLPKYTYGEVPKYTYGEGCYYEDGKKVYEADKWNMFKGECTSYVAFRLNEAGIPFYNHYNYKYYYRRSYGSWASNWAWSKFGNASGWHEIKPGLTLNRRTIKFGSNASKFGPQVFKVTINDDPLAGAVAYWPGGNGASASGHVGYVEEVIDSKTIILSDMNGEQHGQGCTIVEGMRVKNGDKWADGSRTWPALFIHFEEVRR